MEKESGFSGQESLELIQSMINRARHQFSENGHLYLIWGWVVLLCSVGQFILMNVVNYEKHYLVWTLTWVAVIYQTIYLYKKKKSRTVRTYTDDILSFVWVVFIILMFLFGYLFGSVLGQEYYKFINPGFLALYGMPTFLSGVIIRFRPLQIGAVCCWVLSAIAPYVPYRYQILLLSAGVIAAWIVPGYILRARYKKQNS
jgi:hypothetical protein